MILFSVSVVHSFCLFFKFYQVFLFTNWITYETTAILLQDSYRYFLYDIFACAVIWTLKYDYLKLFTPLEHHHPIANVFALILLLSLVLLLRL